MNERGYVGSADVTSVASDAVVAVFVAVLGSAGSFEGAVGCASDAA